MNGCGIKDSSNYRRTRPIKLHKISGVKLERFCEDRMGQYPGRYQSQHPCWRFQEHNSRTVRKAYQDTLHRRRILQGK
ncbi:UNVERIFIED_CONTAM: hypothetical protein Sradi_0181300 [Sesamum radiatum]|uniref:Uncharacterized protein n=1 Tax=Sesamum radiatum TaxID=300843 RepID=A0AAW2VYK0_SESRA